MAWCCRLIGGASTTQQQPISGARCEPLRTGRKGKPIIANIDRLHRLMDRDGLAAMVVRGGQNVTYLAGVSFHGTLGRHVDLAASRRGVLVVWPRQGEPIFVVETTAAGAATRDSWVGRME